MPIELSRTRGGFTNTFRLHQHKSRLLSQFSQPEQGTTYTWLWCQPSNNPFVHARGRLYRGRICSFNERVTDDIHRELLGTQDIVSSILWSPLRHGEGDADHRRIMRELTCGQFNRITTNNDYCSILPLRSSCTGVGQILVVVHWRLFLYLNGARLAIPSFERVDTSAIGLGMIAEVISLYASLLRQGMVQPLPSNIQNMIPMYLGVVDSISHRLRMSSVASWVTLGLDF